MGTPEFAVSSLDHPVLIDDEFSEMDSASATNPSDHPASNNPASDNQTNAANNDIAMRVDMCTASKCLSCGNLLHDEEITVGWSADETNFNTRQVLLHAMTHRKLRIV